MSETKDNGVFGYKITDDGKGIEIVEYKGDDLEAQIPVQIDGLPVTIIGRRAFSEHPRYDHIKSVSIPDSVEVIEEYAFLGCADMNKINIPDSVKAIGYGAFEDCASLGEVSVPSGAKIDDSAFSGDFCGEIVKRN